MFTMPTTFLLRKSLPKGSLEGAQARLRAHADVPTVQEGQRGRFRRTSCADRSCQRFYHPQENMRKLWRGWQ